MEQEQQTSAPKKPFGFFKTIAIGLVVLAGVGVLYLIITSGPTREQKDARRVADRIVGDVQSKNTDDAYTLATPALQKGNTKESFAKSIEEVSPKLQGKSTLTGKTFYEGISATEPAEAIFVYSIATNNGSKYIKVVLQKNDDWRMFTFRSSDTALDPTSRN